MHQVIALRKGISDIFWIVPADKFQDNQLVNENSEVIIDGWRLPLYHLAEKGASNGLDERCYTDYHLSEFQVKTA